MPRGHRAPASLGASGEVGQWPSQAMGTARAKAQRCEGWGVLGNGREPTSVDFRQHDLAQRDQRACRPGSKVSGARPELELDCGGSEVVVARGFRRQPHALPRH